MCYLTKRKDLMKIVFTAIILTALFSSCASAETLWESVNKECLNKKSLVQDGKCLVKDQSFAIIRTPKEQYHYLFVPAIDISGIESPELWISGYPSWFQNAWRNRYIAAPWLGENKNQHDIGIAINSRARRTQQQLHVHLNCIREDITRELNSKVISSQWQPITLTSPAASGRYESILLPGSDIPDNLLPELARIHHSINMHPENTSLFAMQLASGKTVVLTTDYDPANPRSGAAVDLLTNCAVQ